MNKPVPTAITAVSKLDEAVTAILKAQQMNRNMQRSHAPGSDAWHTHETIDDKLHDALGALGQ